MRKALSLPWNYMKSQGARLSWVELGRIFLVGVTDFAMDFSAKMDGFCDRFCGGFLSCVSLKEKTDFGTDFGTLWAWPKTEKGRKLSGGENPLENPRLKSTPSSRWNMLPRKVREKLLPKSCDVGLRCENRHALYVERRKMPAIRTLAAVWPAMPVPAMPNR